MAKLTTIEKVQGCYEKLSSAEKNVANYILKHPGEVVGYTVRELAQASNVSEATVVRMCQHIGYKGYWSFHISLAVDLEDKKEDVGSGEAEDARAILRKYARMIEYLAGNINEESMQKSADLLMNCGYAHIIAGGNTGTLANHLSFRLGRLGICCTMNNVPEYYINHINSAGAKDVVVAISQSGMTKDVLKGIELAREKGLKIIAITAYKDSKIANEADLVLESKGDFSRYDFYKNYSHLCENAVIDTLCDLIQQKRENDNMLELLLSDAKL